LFGFSQGYSQIPNYVPQNGLVGWWPFNGNANDESGNGNNGTVSGASLTSDRFDIPKSCYYFNGMDNVIEVSDSRFIDTTSITISVWIYPEDTIDNKIISKSDWNNASGEMFSLYLEDSLNLEFKSQSSCIPNNRWNRITLTKPDFFLNRWHHLVVSFNNYSRKCYIDGKLVNFENSLKEIDICPGGQLRIGAWWSKDVNYFKGKIDDICIWNRELTDDEVIQLFTQVVSNCVYSIRESDTTICPGTSLKLNVIQTSKTKSLIPQDGLVGYWPFNGNANDESGNGNHGIVDGAILTTNRCGKKDKAYYFDGIDDKITIRDSSNLRPKSITCAAWVYCEDPNPISQILSKNAGNIITESIDMVISNDLGYNFMANIGGPDYYGNWLQSSSKVKDSSWQYMTFVFDSENNKITTYINDKVVGDSIELLEITYDSLPWSIGSQRENGQWSWHFKGKIDDISIWNRPLKIDEVIQAFSYSDCGCEDSLSDSLFTWSNGQKGRTITVNPDISTIYRLTVRDGSTIHQDSIRVSVRGDSCYSCTYGILEQDSVICEGTTLQLHAELSDTTKAYIPKEGLIGYWPFNGNANDESGNGNHGIVYGASLTKGRNGKDNQAYAFDGVDDFIQTNNDSISTDGYAISAWFKTTNNAEGQGLVISRSQSQVDGIYLNKDRIVQCMSNCNKSFHLNEKTIQYNDDKWHHFVSVYDGKQMRGYIDGQLYSMQDQVGTICLNAPFEFGNDRPYARFYKGILDDIAIWNRPLSDEEVVKLFKSESVETYTKMPQDGLIGFWPFNGNAQDQSSLANHGEVNGATLTTDRCEKRNSAYEFNGIDNFIEVKDSESLSNMNSITMSAWIFLDKDSEPNQGIITKWWQGVNCTNNSDNYAMVISNVPQTNNEAKFVCATNNYTNYQLQSTVKVNTDNWMHLSFVHDKTVGGKLFINGVFAGSTDIPGEICKSTNPLLIGADNNRGTYWRFFDGKIDDLAIWNRALSDSEIVDVYKAGSCNCVDTLSEDKFKWSTGEKGRKITVSPNTSTMYTLEVNRGQITDRDTIHVTVLESPKPDIFGHVKVYERQVNYSYYTQLNDSSTYEWKISGNGKLSSTNGGSSILVDFKEPGYAYLTVTETNKYGCKKDTTITIRIYGITDIYESEKNSQMLTIYPNPINEFGSVMVKAFIPPSIRASVSIMDMLGKNLVTSELDGHNTYREIHVPISTESLINGIYMIQLRMDGNVISKKLIINR
jgi:hypothetical protein